MSSQSAEEEEKRKKEDDDARVRRGIAVLQRFSQKKRGGLPMRFNPFNLFTRKRIGMEEVFIADNNNNNNNNNKQQESAVSAVTATTSTASSCSSSPSSSSSSSTAVLFDIVTYTHTPSRLSLPSLMERSEVSAATEADLRGAEQDNVDNTGAYHWAAEDILGHLLLTSQMFPWNNNNNNNNNSSSCVVVELGAGIGLAGFALACGLLSNNNKKQKDQEGEEEEEEEEEEGKGKEEESGGKEKTSMTKIVVTDGNRRVVDLLATNVQRIIKNGEEEQQQKNKKEQKEEEKVKLEAKLLPWQDEEASNSILQDCTHLVGADCLFFESFHSDLAKLVIRFFFSFNNDNQKKNVVFLAPKRGGSLNRFLEVLETELRKRKQEEEGQEEHHHDEKGKEEKEEGDKKEQKQELHLKWTIEEKYDEGIFSIHSKHLAQSPGNGYAPDRHFPLLVTITNNN